MKAGLCRQCSKRSGSSSTSRVTGSSHAQARYNANRRIRRLLNDVSTIHLSPTHLLFSSLLLLGVTLIFPSFLPTHSFFVLFFVLFFFFLFQIRRECEVNNYQAFIGLRLGNQVHTFAFNCCVPTAHGQAIAFHCDDGTVLPQGMDDPITSLSIAPVLLCFGVCAGLNV